MHHRFVVAMGALLACVLAPALPVGPAGAQSNDPLTKNSKDPKMIATQIKSALPLAERGYAMLVSTMDPEPTASAVELLLTSYRYLRAAYQSNDLIISTTRIPDPLLELENRHIMFVRDRLLDCTGNRQYLSDGGPIRSRCIEGLAQGLRTLRTLAATQP